MKVKIPCQLFVSAALVMIFCGGAQQAWAAPAATTTTLAVTSGGGTVTTVASGSVVTLTATVKAGAAAVTIGQVNFCDASAAYCTDIHLLGTEQLTSAGAAVLKFIPGVGSHSYRAIFLGTTSDAGSASSASPPALEVTSTKMYPTTTTIAQSGNAGSYTLTATVTSTEGLVSPTGTVSFLDTSNGNLSLGTAPLGTGTTGLSFLNSWSSAAMGSGYSVAVGDFNGDGIPDLVVANGGSNPLMVLLGSGNGTFTQAANSPMTAGGALYSVAVGDFNGDGIPDLAVTNSSSNTVTVLLGSGNGTFTTKSSPATGSSPQSVAVGDFNGDGIPDLAVANYGSDTVTILLGNGNGAFTQAANSPVTVGSEPSSVTVGDFNGDSIPDLAVANEGSNSVTILLGNGDGTFRQAANSPVEVGIEPTSIAVGDFNRDGIPDLAVANGGSNSVTILLGIGDGTFSFLQGANDTVMVGSDPNSITVVDFNGDGIPDLAVANDVSKSVTILLGIGDGTFSQAPNSPVMLYEFPFSVAVGDFNGDGIPDLATANLDYGGLTATVLLSQLTETVKATANGISPAGTGTHMVEASYPGDNNYNSSISGTTGLTAQQLTPSVTVTPKPTSITTAQALAVTITVGGGTPTPTGSVTLTSGSYTSAVTTLSSGSATINVPAGSLATGSDTLTANYSGDGNYNATTGTASVTVTTAVNPSFTVSGTAVTLAPGAITGNTSTITVTPAGGFTGSVVLTAAVTSSPTGAQYPPTLSFGSTSPVSITGTSAGTATLTITTTAATSAALVLPKRNGVPWYAAGGATLACLLLFGIPARRRRRWQTLLGAVVLLVVLAGGVLACGGGGGSTGGGGGTGNPGTTAGSYTITVTGTSGSTPVTGTVALTVQ